MKKSTYLFLLFLSFTLVQCTSDISDTSDTSASEMTEEDVEERLEETTDVLVADLEIDSSNISEKDKEILKKGNEEKVAIVKEQIEKSPLKTKSCEQIFEEYKVVIDKYITSEDDKVLLELKEWSNDPVYQSCRKNAEFIGKYKELDAKMEAVGDEDVY